MLNYKNIKNIIFILILNTSIFSQILLNGYGFGNKVSDISVGTIGISTNGLVPSYGKNISLDNPSTWHNLNYTSFSASYNSSIYNIKDVDNNEFSNLGIVQFIVPIKNKYSFGLSIVPYYNQYLQLTDKENIFYAFNDTLKTNNSFSSFGGVNALTLSVGGKLIDNVNAAIKISFLYGSTRQQSVFTVDELDYYSQQRYTFTGSLINLYLNSNYLNSYNLPLSAYFMVGLPLNKMSVESTYYSPFEDTDNSGAQGEWDFPSLLNTLDPTISTTKNISAPYEFQLGFEYELDIGLSVLGEISNWNEKEDYGAIFSKLNDQVASINHYSIGIAKFSPELIKSPFDRFNFKLGTYYENIELLNSEKMIKEYGVSTGVSFNFGMTKNQIDFAYSYGKRQGLIGIGDEKIQRFSVGITVGDVWFVKRRAQ